MSYKRDITNIKNDLKEIKAKLNKENSIDYSIMTTRELNRELGKCLYNEPSRVKDPELLNDINTMSEAEFLDKMENMSSDDLWKYIELTLKEVEALTKVKLK